MENDKNNLTAMDTSIANVIQELETQKNGIERLTDDQKKQFEELKQEVEKIDEAIENSKNEYMRDNSRYIKLVK